MNPWCQVGAAYEAFPSSYGGPEAMNSNSVYAAAYQAAYAAAVAATGAAQQGDAAAPAAFGAHAMMAPMIGYMPMMVPQVGGSTGENLWYLFARVAHHMSGFELDCEVMLKYRFVYIFCRPITPTCKAQCSSSSSSRPRHSSIRCLSRCSRSSSRPGS